MVGHSYSVYGPLLLGCTTVLYEGKPVGTPDASNLWRVIERHRVNALFTAPTALRSIKRVDEDGELAKAFDLSSLRTVFLAGERADPDSSRKVGGELAGRAYPRSLVANRDRLAHLRKSRWRGRVNPRKIRLYVHPLSGV